MPRLKVEYDDSIDLFEDCIPCDTIDDVKKHTNKVLLNIINKIDRTSELNERNKEEQPLYTSKDVCKILDIVPRTLDNYCATGQIEYIKTKKFRYFKQEFIDAFLSNKYKRLG